MAFTVTDIPTSRVDASAASSPQTTASFSGIPDNSLLYLIICSNIVIGLDNVTDTFSDSGGGTWTEHTQGTADGGTRHTDLWVRKVGTSAGTGTVSAIYTETSQNLMFSCGYITGADNDSPIGNTANVNQYVTAAPPLTLSPTIGSYTDGSLTLLGAHIGSSVNNPRFDVLDSFTELFDVVGSNWAYGLHYKENDATAQIQINRDSASFYTHAQAFEIKAASGPTISDGPNVSKRAATQVVIDATATL